MIVQIAQEYSGIPDIRTMSNREIRFFYEGIRGELKKRWQSVSK